MESETPPEVCCLASLVFASEKKRDSTSNEVDSNKVEGESRHWMFPSVLHKSTIATRLSTRTCSRLRLHFPLCNWKEVE